jgi:hypothetical protein
LLPTYSVCREIPNAAHSAVRAMRCHRHSEMNCSR